MTNSVQMEMAGWENRQTLFTPILTIVPGHVARMKGQREMNVFHVQTKIIWSARLMAHASTQICVVMDIRSVLTTQMKKTAIKTTSANSSSVTMRLLNVNTGIIQVGIVHSGLGQIILNHHKKLCWTETYFVDKIGSVKKRLFILLGMTTWATRCDNVPECYDNIDEKHCSASLQKLYVFLLIAFFVLVYVTGKDKNYWDFLLSSSIEIKSIFIYF